MAPLPLKPVEDEEHSTYTLGIGDMEEEHEIPRTPTNSENGKVSPIGEQRKSKGNLSPKFESWDYDVCESTLLKAEESTRGYQFVVKKNILRCLITILIGILTGLFAVVVDIVLEIMADYKFEMLREQMDECAVEGCLYRPFVIWLVINVLLVLAAASMVVYIEPVAAGSGIPQLKCYLNGIKIPRLFRIKTMFIKTVAVILSVIGGLAVGKEPPITNAGAVIAAGVSQGMIPSLGKDFGFFKYFREDREKRDFVSCGSAAGVAAAFGSPIGGLLFALEEGASFWNQSLTWRMFVGTLVTVFTINLGLSTYHGHPGELSYAGLVNFGKFNGSSYDLMEIPLFIIMGIIGGLFGALYNFIFYKMALLRARYFTYKYQRIIEACCVALLTPCVGMAMFYFIDDCNPLAASDDGITSPDFPVQMFCPKGQYSAAATLWFNRPEAKVRSMLHESGEAHGSLSLVVFGIFYFTLSVLTMGLTTGSGLYLPCILIGGSWGRFIGKGVELMFPGAKWLNATKYAFIGGAAQLGGILRMTVSLTAILVEATGDLTLALPIMLTLTFAKFTGDYFTDGFYDICIHLMNVPHLDSEPPPLSRHISAKEVMSSPVHTLNTVENVGKVVDTLKNKRYSGFPVVDVDTGRFKGLMLRTHLVMLLKHKLFKETEFFRNEELSLELFRTPYPHNYPDISEVEVTEEERGYTMDLGPIMNLSPYVVRDAATLPRIFSLFRGLGLRHLVVLNDQSEVVGMVTRIDLAKYKVHHRMGKMKLVKLNVLEYY